jgi:hypothetical protein
VFAELVENRDIDRALERHDQLWQFFGPDPFPGIEFGMFVSQVNIGIFANKAHREPDLLLAAIPAAPHAAGDFDRQIVTVQDLALGDDLGFAGADFLAELAPRRLARRLAGVDAALRHLPCRQPRRHVDAAAGENQPRAVDQDDADPGSVIGKRIDAGGSAQLFAVRPLNSAIPRNMSTARAS